MRRIPWSTIAALLIVVALVFLIAQSWHEVLAAIELLRGADPIWLCLALVAVGTGFVCAGQIYGRVLAVLGHSAHFLWLTGTAMVAILINQSIPGGSVAAYAFLVASLRRKRFPVASVAMVAGTELLSWNGAVLISFTYGLVYLILTSGINGASVSYGAVILALLITSGLGYAGSRSDDTLHDWAQQLKGLVNRMFGPIWTQQQVVHVIDEIIASRRLLFEQPWRMLLLVILQLLIFMFHSMALLAILYGLGVVASPFAVAAAYGLALIVSTFVILPGGGGAVETALTLALRVQGVPPEAAIGAAIVFRLLSFWLLLPVGGVLYHVLTRSPVTRPDAE
ncbi:MAG TPA: lysylphosphatidylglycerol synthase transmembrane domain-containing protein [Roseiflexaceae bacterium]|nr:lysylphosphatidylglycerol synthase transmembrane domain-containing protein [Roseiflexaceae bacterium]